VINLVDIAYLIDYVYYDGNGPYPFMHLGDVNADGAVDAADVTYLIDYYFNFGPCMPVIKKKLRLSKRSRVLDPASFFMFFPRINNHLTNRTI